MLESDPLLRVLQKLAKMAAITEHDVADDDQAPAVTENFQGEIDRAAGAIKRVHGISKKTACTLPPVKLTFDHLLLATSFDYDTVIAEEETDEKACCLESHDAGWLFRGTKPWDLDFHMLAWGDELERYAKDLGNEGDLLIFGRKTLRRHGRLLADRDGNARDRHLYERHRQDRRLADDGQGGVEQHPRHSRHRRRSQETEGRAWRKTIFVFGSAEVADTLLKAGLVDEIRICLVPVVLGSGNPHFKPAGEQIPMTLLRSTPLKTGAVILRYEPAKATSKRIANSGICLAL